MMSQFPGVDFGFTQPIEMRISEMLTGSRGDLAIKIFGPDLGSSWASLRNGSPSAWQKWTERRTFRRRRRMALPICVSSINPQAAGRAGLAVADVQ